MAEAKRGWRQEHGRLTRPWIPEPGLWLQWDYGEGPVVDGRSTVVWCAWLAWSRYRVVLALRDKTLPSVVMALDVTLRAVGGAPTYCLTDNEKTVSVDHVCGIAVRNPTMMAVTCQYGLSIATCVPADPHSKGGSQATVKIAKADLVGPCRIAPRTRERSLDCYRSSNGREPRAGSLVCLPYESETCQGIASQRWSGAWHGRRRKAWARAVRSGVRENRLHGNGQCGGLRGSVRRSCVR